MAIINHQLLTQSYFIPSWKIKHLFLGTFNPEGGQQVSYFYGRSKNFTWQILNEIFPNQFRNNQGQLFPDFLERVLNQEIACMDMIRSVNVTEEKLPFVIGNGYSDTNIINNNVLREYNTDLINNVIRENPGIKVYTTWGKGSNLKNWKKELQRIEAKLIPLVSPSPVARVPKGVEKYPNALRDWKSKIIL